MRIFLILPAVLAAVLFACSDGDGEGDDGSPESVMRSLPAFSGATLVREWTVSEGGRNAAVREYATSLPLREAPDAVTKFYREYLVKEGWKEGEARAAVSGFTKGEMQVLLGRVGPQLMEAPTGASVRTRSDAPAGTQFYFTVEVTSR